MADWQNRGGFGACDGVGPKPTLFFAPDHVATTIAERGPKGRQVAVGDRWRAFAGDAPKRVKIENVSGLTEAIPAWIATVEGRAVPQLATVILFYRRAQRRGQKPAPWFLTFIMPAGRVACSLELGFA